ncbi:MAG: hypothetical protein RMK29_14690 [Myxococcales bacterium]|nr:hypothetical protein [Myxococcota bacterium]MDW8282960.1 hypothetical protein [Myxococcales bacterium]
MIPGAILLLATSSMAASPPTSAGCPPASELPETAEAYQARAQQARSAGDHAAAAEQLWSAWCRSGRPGLLVQICQEHLQGQQCVLGQEIVRYARRRQAMLAPAEREALVQCGQQLRQACGAPGMQVEAQPAQESERTPPPQQPSQGAVAPQLGTLRLVLGGPPAGVRIFVDDQEHVESEVQGAPGLRLEAGRHRIVVQQPGYEFRQTVHLVPGGTAVIYVPLRATRHD